VLIIQRRKKEGARLSTLQREKGGHRSAHPEGGRDSSAIKKGERGSHRGSKEVQVEDRNMRPTDVFGVDKFGRCAKGRSRQCVTKCRLHQKAE